jgi:hypothetical protein
MPANMTARIIFFLLARAIELDQCLIGATARTLPERANGPLP